MKKLLSKYILLNKRNVIYGILAAIFFSMIHIDGHQYYSVALMMCPSLLFSFVVGKMCYMEDSVGTQQFLLSLPISKKDIIFEKNIMSYICIILGMCISNIGGYIIDRIKEVPPYFSIKLIAIIFVFLLIYNTIYIALNYKYDYSKTQFTPYIILGFMILLFKFGNEFMKFVSTSNLWLLFAICLGGMLLNYVVLECVAKEYKSQ